MKPNETIRARLLVLIASGMTVSEAFDAVLGAGAYAKLAADVYAALRSEVA